MCSTYNPARHTPHNLSITVESGAQWVRWTRSHGMRRLWDRLSEQEAEELAAEVASRLDALCRADGTMTLPTTIVYMRARGPPQLAPWHQTHRPPCDVPTGHPDHLARHQPRRAAAPVIRRRPAYSSTA